MARIAVVEDDADTSMVMRDALREAGHEVVSYFQPSVDISEHIRRLKPDLVLIDARLNPSVSGWDIIEALKQDEELSRVPIAMVSGASIEIERHQEMLGRYDVPVLPKPFSLDDLEALVDRMVVS